MSENGEIETKVLETIIKEVETEAPKEVDMTESNAKGVKPKKEKKKRKPMTPEHKAKVLAGLAKAREKSALARAKRK